MAFLRFHPASLLNNSVLEMIAKESHTDTSAVSSSMNSKDYCYETIARFSCLINVFLSLKCSLDIKYRRYHYRNYKLPRHFKIYLVINKCTTILIF